MFWEAKVVEDKKWIKRKLKNKHAFLWLLHFYIEILF